MARHARDVAGIGAGNGGDDEKRVLDAAGHGPELVERPAERHRSRPGHPAKRRPEARHPAAHRRVDDASLRLASNRKRDQGGRRRRARTRAAPARPLLEEPWVHRLPAEPDVVQRESAQAELGQKDGSGVVEPLDDDGVGVRDPVPEGLGAPGRLDPLRVEEVLRSPRNSVERAAVLSRFDLRVRAAGLRQRQVFRQRDDALQLRIEPLDPLEVDPCQPLGAQGPSLDPARQGRDGREGDVLVAPGQRPRAALARAPHEPVPRGPCGYARDHGVPARRRGERGLEGDPFRASAPLHGPRHRLAPVSSGLCPIGCGQLDARELLGLHERGDCYLGPHGRRRPERGRRPGGGCCLRRCARHLRLGDRSTRSGSACDSGRGPREELPAGFRHGVPPSPES